MISLYLPPSPLIVANIAEHPPTETSPLKYSSLPGVFTVPSLHRYFLLPLTAAGYGETILKSLKRLNCFEFFWSTDYWHIGNIMLGLVSSQIRFLLEQPLPVTSPSVMRDRPCHSCGLTGFSHIYYRWSNNFDSRQTHCRTCSPRQRCLCSKPGPMLRWEKYFYLELLPPSPRNRIEEDDISPPLYLVWNKR